MVATTTMQKLAQKGGLYQLSRWLEASEAVLREALARGITSVVSIAPCPPGKEHCTVQSRKETLNDWLENLIDIGERRLSSARKEAHTRQWMALQESMIESANPVDLDRLGFHFSQHPQRSSLHWIRDAIDRTRTRLIRNEIGELPPGWQVTSPTSQIITARHKESPVIVFSLRWIEEEEDYDSQLRQTTHHSHWEIWRDHQKVWSGGSGVWTEGGPENDREQALYQLVNKIRQASPDEETRQNPAWDADCMGPNDCSVPSEARMWLERLVRDRAIAMPKPYGKGARYLLEHKMAMETTCDAAEATVYGAATCLLKPTKTGKALWERIMGERTSVEARRQVGIFTNPGMPQWKRDLVDLVLEWQAGLPVDANILLSLIRRLRVEPRIYLYPPVGADREVLARQIWETLLAGLPPDQAQELHAQLARAGASIGNAEWEALLTGQAPGANLNGGIDMHALGQRAVRDTSPAHRREAWEGITEDQAIEWITGMADGDEVDYPTDQASLRAFMEGVAAALSGAARANPSGGMPAPAPHVAEAHPGDILYDAEGRQYPIRYEIIAANLDGKSSLVVSHDPSDLAQLTPGYPQQFQARDLGSFEEQAKIRKISSSLDPMRLLGRNLDPTIGAPVVWEGPDGRMFALGGNGRSIAFLLAPDERYRAYLKLGGELWGCWPKKEAPKGTRWVLVRVVRGIGIEGATRLAAASQASTAADESRIGKARSLARGLGLKIAEMPPVEWLQPLAKENTIDFWRDNGSFVDHILSGMDPAKASLYRNDAEKLQPVLIAAMLAALPEESTKPGIFSDTKVEDALIGSLPALLTIRSGIQSGRLWPVFDLLSILPDSLSVFGWLRRYNLTFGELQRAIDLERQTVRVEGVRRISDVSNLSLALAAAYYNAARRAAPEVAIAEILRGYYRAASEYNPRQASMFGGGSAPDPAPILASQVPGYQAPTEAQQQGLGLARQNPKRSGGVGALWFDGRVFLDASSTRAWAKAHHLHAGVPVAAPRGWRIEIQPGPYDRVIPMGEGVIAYV